MKRKNLIVTVGLSPAWDITCRGRNLDWGRHQVISSCLEQPAGKALNISRALAWLGEESIAASLWGQDDYKLMLEATGILKKYVGVKITAVAGSTRRNITIVDTAKGRDMHLRSRSDLATTKALRKLKADLEFIVRQDSVCVFAGAIPEGKLLGDVVRIVKSCREKGAKIVLDTSGAALRRIVDTGTVWLIKPNVEELCELLGETIRNVTKSLVKAGQKLLDKVEVVLISRGDKGAIVVTKKGAWHGRYVGRAKVLSTVGCGDYLLAGFLIGLKDKYEVAFALETAIKVATAKAWDRTENEQWPQVRRQIQVEVYSY
jgi:1-phosphofructokinase family hexose kinase